MHRGWMISTCIGQLITPCENRSHELMGSSIFTKDTIKSGRIRSTVCLLLFRHYEGHLNGKCLTRYCARKHDTNL